MNIAVEKDVSGFQFVSSHPLSAVYAVVRCWSDRRKFTIEDLDGSNGVSYCTVPGTLLSLLQDDVCHAAGNIKVIITGEVCDNLRLIRRGALRVPTARLDLRLIFNRSIPPLLVSICGDRFGLAVKPSEGLTIRPI
jgi:hypothetical protein